MQYNNNNDGNIKNDGVYNNNDDNDDDEMIMIMMMMIKYYIELILFIRHFQHITTMTRFPSSLSIHLSKLAFSG